MNHSTTIRGAGASDRARVTASMGAMVRAMHHHGGYQPASDEEMSRVLGARFDERIVRDDCLYLLALDGDDVAGMVEAGAYDRGAVFAPAIYLHVHAVYVEPSRRRAGIGRSLVKHVLDWGRARGCRAAELNVLASNPAWRLYEAMGFEVLGVKMSMAL